MSLTTIEYRGREAVHRLGPAYDELLLLSGAPLTARRPWMQTWVDCYEDWEPWVLALSSGNGRLEAVAALARRQRGPLLEVRGLGQGPADELRLPLREPALAHRIGSDVLAALGGSALPWHLQIDQLPAGCPVAVHLRSATRTASLKPGQGLPRVAVEAGACWTKYLRKSARQSERTARNRLAGLGILVQETWTSDADEIDASLPDLMRVHRARDLSLGRRPDHDDFRAATFYQRIVRQQARGNHVELLRLLLDGDLAAYVLAFRDGQTLRVWDARLNPRYAQYSAGRLSHATTLRKVVDDPGLAELDWMRGEEPYKLASATHIEPTIVLNAWSSPSARLPSQTLDFLKRVRARSTFATYASSSASHRARLADAKRP